MENVDISRELETLAKASPKDVKAFRRIFDSFDLDESGAISLSELHIVMNNWGEPLSENEAAGLLKELDLNSDGKVGFEEFRHFILRLSSFDRAHRSRAFQSAYEKWVHVLHELDEVLESTERVGKPQKALVRNNINPCIQRMRYEVRGELVLNAERIANELAQGKKRDFEDVLFFNIGNPHSVGGTPITFYRQVLALCDCPSLLDDPQVKKLFPDDVIAHALNLRRTIPGGTGAYTNSQGLKSVRSQIADFIEKRDGYPAMASDIFLTNGASSGITMLMQLLLAGPKDCILVPIPQYPIYTALIEMMDAQAAYYYLDEETGWSLSVDELEHSFAVAKARGLTPKAMVVINPGNPTGNLMGQETLEEIVRFCRRNRLVLLSDEVYQENVYIRDRSFVSLKKVTRSLGSEFDDFELASFHSTSKGIIGECGRRGGYVELCGIDPEVQAELYKLACVNLCPNVDGQLMVQLMVNPPKPGEASYQQFQSECDAVFGSLKRKSLKIVKTLNALAGISCKQVEGAMYVFPRIRLPEAAIAAAEKDGLSPDMHYCLSLLETAGICTVPGSGFGQKKGTYHLRMTFLPDEAQLTNALDRFTAHHNAYMARYKANGCY
ncbi:MAG: aminotransferase class I/II-fold pyridoxal phosphate-dependent enzyme [Proteobacteria bacterium]|nr:aminotransferase class I/II-fold pyridoxal phosphate-dependent enzyme [Pseudomonadota bacterium]